MRAARMLVEITLDECTTDDIDSADKALDDQIRDIAHRIESVDGYEITVLGGHEVQML